ncbi:MAG TPA: chalcone isomerase family protein [Kiritimatiellia bacterium]|nr:chalcone isomerase family protein [Kiritimatiellia bacterium]HMP35792.1 chalcone isomerase family protein [Kiritimatiellia bacterium]
MNKFLLLLTGWLGACTVAMATPSFPATVTLSDGVTLERRGVSQLTVGYIFKVYHAALYLPPGSGPEDALADAPRHLEIHYLRNISREDFIKAADDMLTAQHAPEVIRSIQAGIDQINALYRDVKKGDRYALTYQPGIGTTLTFNGEVQGVIEGADFARIYFSIWLGENNPYQEFRDRLVGLRK